VLGRREGVAEALERLRALDAAKARELEAIAKRIARQLAGER
jgi:hypothetical protein